MKADFSSLLPLTYILTSDSDFVTSGNRKKGELYGQVFTLPTTVLYSRGEDLMDQPDEALQELSLAVYNFCWEHRSFAKGKLVDYKASKELVSLAGSVLPKIVKYIDHHELPSVIGAREIVSYGVKGSDPKLSVILERYFFQGGSVPSIAKELYYCEKTIRRHISSLPNFIAVQLMGKNHELAVAEANSKPNLFSADHEDEIAMQNLYGLSIRQSQVLQTFRKYTSLGRPQICEILNIGMETLNTHRKAILAKMGSGTINEAVEKANRDLGKGS